MTRLHTEGGGVERNRGLVLNPQCHSELVSESRGLPNLAMLWETRHFSRNQKISEKVVKRVQHDSKKAFTLAEVLITLVVIGVVAAITIPILRQSSGDKEYDAARKVALMTIGQAGRQMAANGELTLASNAEDFVKNYFSKYVKIAKECGTNLSECGFSEKIKTMAGTEIELPTTVGGLLDTTNTHWGLDPTSTGYAFTLANGYAVNLFYNPTCASDTNSTNPEAPGYVCVNAVYDMNGKSKPNKVGKDIGFVTVVYPNVQSVAVAPNPHNEDANGGSYTTWFNAPQACLDQNENLIVPNKDELLAMRYNKKLIANMASDIYWSSSEYSDITRNWTWIQNLNSGTRGLYEKDDNGRVRCVWR